MEPHPVEQYTVAAYVPVDDYLICDCCHYVIGPKVNHLGHKNAVLIGGVTVYAIHGWCPNCGRPLHWTSNDDRLKRIMARVKMGA